jgi:hypothetical protein
VKRKPNPPTHSAVGAGVREVLSAEFVDQPFGVVGEWATPRYDPAPPAPPPFVIPPPPWSENYRPELDPDHEPPQRDQDVETPE